MCRRFLIFLLIAFAAACAASDDDELVDRSFVTGQPCAPPCWYGLILDESTQADVEATLHKLPFVLNIRQFEMPWLDDLDANEITFGCLKPGHRVCGGMRLSRDRLKLLWYSVGYKLTFETVVEQLGAPEYIDYGYYHPDVGGSRVTLYWPDQGISVEALDTRRDALFRLLHDGGQVPPGTEVRGVYFAVREGFGPEPAGCCFRIPWPGFAR